MESPIYKLEKVVQGKEELQDFEGPLDLILFLLSKNKIEIQDIPIALILDQYLAYLDRRKEMDLEVASEFVTMAAHLMYIKTRMLLSLEDEEAKNEMDALIQSLAERQRGEAYARVRRLAELLGPMGEFGRSIMTRQPEPMQRGKIYEYSHEKADLVLAICTDMARRVASDGEGATHLIEVEAYGLPTEHDARLVAKSIAGSMLFKAAVFGRDANWGRILCAIGYTPGDFSIDKVSVRIASKAGEVFVCENAAYHPFSEDEAYAVLGEHDILVKVDMGTGEASGKAWGCDLTYDYVKINGDYRT